jgi:hypothetical protein
MRRSGVLIGYGDGMSAPPHGSEDDNTVIPLAQAPGLVELARRARAHEQITLTEAGADNVLIMSVGDHQAILDWEAAFIAETVASTARRGPHIPNDLLAALDAADPATAEAFLTRLEARAGEDIPAEQQWALWERMTSA